MFLGTLKLVIHALYFYADLPERPTFAMATPFLVMWVLVPTTLTNFFLINRRRGEDCYYSWAVITFNMDRDNLTVYVAKFNIMIAVYADWHFHSPFLPES